MIRRIGIALGVALIASACANSQLGRSIPACPADDEAISQISASMILQMQAVDTAKYVPCLNDLNAGWTYQHLVPERGKSRFQIDSDRLGSGFLEVSLLAACDTAGLAEINSSREDVSAFRNVELVGSTVTVAIVPITGREIEYARRIETELEARQINGRQVFVIFDEGDEPLVDKVAKAARADRPLIILDEQDELAQTATLQMPADRSIRGLDFEDLLDVLEGRLPKPSMVGTWVQIFDGGCIRYEIDASGPGVDRLAGDIEEAVGLFPAGDVRQVLRDAGILG